MVLHQRIPSSLMLTVDRFKLNFIRNSQRAASMIDLEEFGEESDDEDTDGQ